MGRGTRKEKFYDNPITENVKEEVNKALADQSPAEMETRGPETINGTVINSLFVKVRREPNFESDVIEVLRKGDRVIILGKDGEFHKVSTSVNKIAYISSEFIREE